MQVPLNEFDTPGFAGCRLPMGEGGGETIAVRESKISVSANFSRAQFHSMQHNVNMKPGGYRI